MLKHIREENEFLENIVFADEMIFLNLQILRQIIIRTVFDSNDSFFFAIYIFFKFPH